MSGESGAANRHGEILSISVDGRPSAASSMPGSLVAAVVGSKPLATGLKAATVCLAARQCPMSAALRKVLPISVPVPVTKIAVTARCFRHDWEEPGAEGPRA